MTRAGARQVSLALVLVLLTGCQGSLPAPTGPVTTGPPAGGTTTLLVVGDWGAGTSEQEAIAQEMSDLAEAEEIGAILTTGDNLYTDGDRLIDPFEWATDAGIPFWVAWGNHDIESGERVETINEVYDHPPRWTSHRWGNVEIVILDSTQLDSGTQIDFLTETLEASDLPTIMVFHHPPFSCGSHGDTEAIQETWVSLFDEDVFLVLSGHEHNYQRFETSDITYLVTGGGGASLTELRSCPTDHPERVSGEALHHFLAMEQDDGIVVTVIDRNGEVVDEFELTLP